MKMHRRNTPTPVGKTVTPNSYIKKDWKHPHACGEDRLPNEQSSTVAETPPRLWGRLLQRHTLFIGRGNTPTPVGKTGGSPWSGHLLEKHPHACGEDTQWFRVQVWEKETPPRLWGRLILLTSPNQSRRNTPTPVGKTRVSFLVFVCRGETPPRLWGRR